MTLVKYRKEAKLSQKMLAKLSGVSQQHISHLEVHRRDPERMALGDCRAIVDALRNSGARCDGIDDVFPPSVGRIDPHVTHITVEPCRMVTFRSPSAAVAHQK